MTEFAARTGHVISDLVLGLTYVVAGVLVLIAQVEGLRLQWSVVAPVALLLLGLGLLVTAFVDQHVTRGGERR